jgi:hypothetical protein
MRSNANSTTGAGVASRGDAAGGEMRRSGLPAWDAFATVLGAMKTLLRETCIASARLRAAGACLTVRAQAC